MRYSEGTSIPSQSFAAPEVKRIETHTFEKTPGKKYRAIAFERHPEPAEWHANECSSPASASVSTSVHRPPFTDTTAALC